MVSQLIDYYGVYGLKNPVISSEENQAFVDNTNLISELKVIVCAEQPEDSEFVKHIHFSSFHN